MPSLTELIEAAVEDDEAAQPLRTHLGGSQIGRPCNRELWYTFRWARPKGTFEGRMLRLFARGKREEDVFIRLLQRIGVVVDQQQLHISDVEGHFGGSLDAILSHIPNYQYDMTAVLECKTANERNFNLIRSGPISQTKPEHYAQLQSYMHGTGQWLSLYMVVNKNTDELHYEWVPYNRLVAEALLTRARQVIYASSPPNRISDSPSWFQCRGCGFYRQCHFAEPLHKSCRTCKHSVPASEGTWICRRHQDATIPLEFQLKGCDDYAVITD
jgi:hypothetical protein